MFTQKCFIRKNSKELQDKVYRLGGRSGTCLWESEFSTLLAVSYEYFRCYDDEWDNDKALIKGCYIDCGTNEQLFLALAALRDDSDINQWFVHNTLGFFIECTHEEFHLFAFNPFDALDYKDTKDEFHKATPQELIEHFKDK